MNKKFVIIFCVLAILLGAFFLLTDSSSASNKPVKNIYSNWNTEYKRNSNNALDLGFFNELIATHTSDSIYGLSSWDDLEKIPRYEEATYLFINNKFGLEDAIYDSLVHLVDSGATMLLAFDYTTENIYTRHFSEGAYFWEFSNKLHVWVGDTSLRYNSVLQNDTLAADWYVFDEMQIIDTNYVAYTFALNHPVSFYEKHSKGKIHFHSIPQLFQNYQVIQPNGFAHSEIILKQIPKNKPVIWLDLAILKDDIYSSDVSDEAGDGNDEQDNSLIQYILKNESLRVAFVLAIILLLVYVLFRAKRRERIIEGIEVKRNMSLAFVETLSSIYLSRNSPISILHVLRKNFYQTVSRHFYIDLSHKETRAENIERLIEKSDYDPEKLNALIKSLNTTGRTVNSDELGEIYRQIRVFYIETGINKKPKSFTSKSKEITVHKSLLSGSIGLVVSFFFFLQGLLLLSYGGGIGVILVLIGALLLYLSYRLISAPLMLIKENELIVYGLFNGKKTYSLNQGIQATVSANQTSFYFEDGSVAVINHLLLSRRGKSNLAQFVEFTKLQNI